MLQEIIKEDRLEIQLDNRIKKIRACPYYSPFKAICVNPNHPGYDEDYNRQPRCSLRGKYSECSVVDKIIELTMDRNNTIIHREYLYIKGRVNMEELEENIKKEDKIEGQKEEKKEDKIEGQKEEKKEDKIEDHE